MDSAQGQAHSELRRLPAEYYQGRAYVHWSMTIDERKTGWLIAPLCFKFREILTHTAFRNGGWVLGALLEIVCAPLRAGLRGDGKRGILAETMLWMLCGILTNSAT
jgi:hypothetical protein